MVRVLLAASLAALAMLASAQILSPVNGNNYTIFNAHNNRCALLIGPFTNDYVPVVMGSCTGGTNELWTAHVNPTDATLVSFSSVALPGSWLSYSTAEIAGGPDSMHQHTIVHYTPYEWYIGRSPSICASNSSTSGVLTSLRHESKHMGKDGDSAVSSYMIPSSRVQRVWLRISTICTRGYLFETHMLSKAQMVKGDGTVTGKNPARQERTVPIARESYQNRIQTILAELTYMSRLNTGSRIRNGS
ncbi:hypothetical protein B0H13DRAFT_1874074 [Mycena leptocephala]|nr:hypothetical protein B0H13DRAFT_1874074 [Mycena leptocephala]